MEVVEASCRNSLFVCPSEVEYEAAIVSEFGLNQAAELGKPINIFALIWIAVVLLALESEGRARHYKVNAAIRKLCQKLQRVAAVCCAELCPIDGRAAKHRRNLVPTEVIGSRRDFKSVDL